MTHVSSRANNTEFTSATALNPAQMPRKVSLPVKAVGWILARREPLIVVWLLTFITLFCILVMTAPNYEWDVVAYIANAMQLIDPQPIEVLQANVYTALNNSIPAHALEQLIDSPSRVILSQDPEAFRQTIAFFYDSRIIYIHIIATLIYLGFDPVVACYVFSIFCAVMSLLMLTRLMPVNVPIGLYIVLPFVVLACGLLDVARLATPDALATFVTVMLYYLLFQNRVYSLLILLPFVVFVRTDLILLIAMFHAYFLFFGRCSRIATIISGAATLVAFWFLNTFLIDPDPWSSLIGYSFGEKPTHPNTFVFEITPENYASYILEGLMSFSYNPIGFVFCMLAVIGIVLYSAKYFVDPGNFKITTLHADVLFLLISCVAYLTVHFLLFPVVWTRFFAAQYSLVAVVVVWTTLSILAARNYSAYAEFDLLKERSENAK